MSPALNLKHKDNEDDDDDYSDGTNEDADDDYYVLKSVIFSDFLLQIKIHLF